MSIDVEPSKKSGEGAEYAWWIFLRGGEAAGTPP
jgi:hypothetical protein